MKKGLKIIGIILGVIIILGIIFFIVDYNRVKKQEKPIFCINIGTFSDGGTKEYIGLGYKVIDFHTLTGYDDIKIGTWFMDYNNFNDEIKEKEKQFTVSTLESLIRNMPHNIEVETAVKNGYFVITVDKIYNKNILDSFVKKFKNNDKSSDTIIIAVYNYDGYPTIYGLEYNEKGYILITDATRNNISPKEITVNSNISREIYELKIIEDSGISAGSISLIVKDYVDIDYKNIEIARYPLGNIDKINIEQKVDSIVENGPQNSSNPFDYIEVSKDTYNELLNNSKETFEYAIKDLIDTKANNGVKSYIEALLCSKINTNFKCNFESGIDYLERYKEFLLKSDSIFNNYDVYAKDLLK